MSAFYKATCQNFLATNAEQIVGQLSAALIKNFSGDHSRQLDAWRRQVFLLQSALRKATQTFSEASDWGVLFEYPLLRLQRRLDVVLLAGSAVAVVEFKVGANAFAMADIRQVEDYALDLRDFRQGSRSLPIIPVLCATDAGPWDGRLSIDPSLKLIV